MDESLGLSWKYWQNLKCKGCDFGVCLSIGTLMQSPKLQCHQLFLTHRHCIPKSLDPNRRQTRATNATAHPGNVVKDVLAVRRKQEDIEEEKKDRNERQKAQEKKKADAQVAIKHIADFENDMALEDRTQETRFPQHQTEGT
jgi:hypothetical protein